MRGSVRRSRDAWQWVVSTTDPATGRRRQVSKSGFETKKAAQLALRAALVEMDRGSWREPTSETLGSFLERWLEGMAAQVKPTTFNGYESHLRTHVVPRLAALPLCQLDGARLNGLYADLLESGGRKGTGVSARTVGHVHKLLHRAMRDAVRWGLLFRNPVDDADPPRVEVRPPKTWSTELTSTFLRSIEDERLAACWWLALTTGMRRGELLGLRWSDVDLDGRRVSISQTLVSAGYEMTFSTPKTRSSRRRIAIAPVVVTRLSEHRRQQLQERLRIGPGWQDHDLVFCREDGSPIHPHSLTFRWFKAVEAAGVPRIRLHDARHTVATTALKSGIHPKVVADQLGHASISITLDTYSHVIDGLSDQAAATIAEAVSGGDSLP